MFYEDPMEIETRHCELGPLVDDGASYSAIGLTEFYLLYKDIHPRFGGNFDALPVALGGCKYWQYGTQMVLELTTANTG